MLTGAMLTLAAPASAAVTCTGASLGMALGTYLGDTSTPLDSMAAFSLTCSRSGGPSAVSITLGIGPSPNSGSISPRQMRWSSGGDLLSYNIYRDAGRLSVWGQTAGVDTVTQTLSVPNRGSASTAFTLYGRIDPLQNVHPGFYSDNHVITVTY